MKQNKIIYIISIAFISIMIFLTLNARTIHNQSLHHVSTVEVKKQDFDFVFTDEQGNLCHSKRRAIGIPKKYANDRLFIVTEFEIYGETRKRATQVDVMYYEDYISDEYNAVSFGVSIGDKIIVDSDNISDGCEVIVLE